MIGGKGNSRNRPTALGSLLNAATYNATIPTIIGMTRTTFLAIWAANIRSGGSNKKSKKKGITTYIENVDFLLGSAPIENVLRMWSNNTNRYLLNFLKYRSGIGPNVTIPDSNFYALIGATAEVDISANFNDFGDPSSGSIQHATITNAGSGYLSSPPGTPIIVRVDGPGRPAFLQCTDNFSGLFLDYIVLDGGSGFELGVTYGSTIVSGVGSGATFTPNTLSNRSMGGLSEYPLWNVWQQGSDLINAGSSRFWPYVYGWRPENDNVVNFLGNCLADFRCGIPHGNGIVNLYYAALNGSMDGDSPLQFNRMHFEKQLGDGTEYADAGLTSQQIIYPMYAGVGSSEADLGASGLLPDWRVETKGSWYRWPTGDADFVDMIEDAVKSGQIQAGEALGLIQRGVNCNDLPGFVQKAIWTSLEPSNPAMTFYQANGVGTILLAIFQWRSGGVVPAPSDTAANTWNTVLGTAASSLFWAKSVGFQAGNQVQSNAGADFDARFYIFESDPGSDTVEDTDASSGPGAGLVTLSVTVAAPSSMLFLYVDGVDVNHVDLSHWKNLLPNLTFPPGFAIAQPLIYQRNVMGAGTYSVVIDTSASLGYTASLVAISPSQPTPLPATLGDILDFDSLELTRKQCWANGLYGSVWMNSQRKVTDWMTEFYQCANAAPVWSGDKLKTIPWSEASFVGNGVVYNAPTAGGPVATLLENDLIAKPDEPLILFTRRPQSDSMNIEQIECVDRANDYNIVAMGEPESGAAAIYGPTKSSPVMLHELQDPAIARKILKVKVNRDVQQRNQYEFTAIAKWSLLEAMDLIYIDQNLIGVAPTQTTNNYSINVSPRLIPVRLLECAEDKDKSIKMTAEDFIYGVNAPTLLLTATATTANNPNSQVIPGVINPPIIAEIPLRMSSSGKSQIEFIVSDSDPAYGGSLIYVSTDGGVSYGDSPIGIIKGNAVTGYVTNDYPAASDPDATDNLLVDLTESRGTLPDYTTDEENNFLFPYYLGATPSPTPNVLSTISFYSGLEPSGCVNYEIPPIGSFGVLAARTRGAGMSIWFRPPGDTGVVRFRSSNNNCGQADQAYARDVTVPPNCLCGKDNHDYGAIQGGPGTFLYEFESFGFTLDQTLGPQSFCQGPAGTLVSCQEVIFDASTAGVETFGGVIYVLRFLPVTPGNPALYVAVCSGMATFPAPAGWTLLAAGNGISTYQKVGTVSEPPNSYEIITYADATLTSPNNYVVNGSVDPVRRSVFGVPIIGEGIDHDIGSRFGFMGAWQGALAPTPGTLKVDLDPSWINKDLFFKFVQFNSLGSGFANIADVVPYMYTPTGLLTGTGGGGGGSGGTIGGGTGGQGNPQQPTYTVTGGELTQPTATEIDMAKAFVNFSTGNAVYYNARTFSIPAPTVPTSYFITIFDPNFLGDTGTSTTLTAQASSDSSLVGVPGYVYIGSIVAIPGGGGSVTIPGGYPPNEQILVNGI